MVMTNSESLLCRMAGARSIAELDARVAQERAQHAAEVLAGTKTQQQVDALCGADNSDISEQAQHGVAAHGVLEDIRDVATAHFRAAYPAHAAAFDGQARHAADKPLTAEQIESALAALAESERVLAQVAAKPAAPATVAIHRQLGPGEEIAFGESMPL